MKWDDALWGWVQSRIVLARRPDDAAAEGTLAFFESVLRERFGVAEMSFVETSDGYETVCRFADGSIQSERFDRQRAERLLSDIEATSAFSRPFDEACGGFGDPDDGDGDGSHV
ncbi:MAG: hypothetical protein BLM47_02895 [Candidatus Reconcilbacillus cellulovorans]|uniref:Uncharacterized protein n=1 Tax=Candidatus Reconcilbacillus cellulovorans TaxID=1906605 RepID=A0A2A6E1H4_9BACL|nr:MAG: hypothetical protein BLM47_02895 [Candidatus Reconcilbacillus cellulovorans]